jgi:hypothetical protein
MTIRRSLAAGFLMLGFALVAAGPASAQVETLYTGVTPPVINTPTGSPPGAVLATSGERTAPAQVLASQTSGAVAATSQGSVQGLAFTGADIAGLVTLGFSLLAVGLVLTRRARARALPPA